jgi:hypothetical protein
MGKEVVSVFREVLDIHLLLLLVFSYVPQLLGLLHVLFLKSCVWHLVQVDCSHTVSERPFSEGILQVRPYRRHTVVTESQPVSQKLSHLDGHREVVKSFDLYPFLRVSEDFPSLLNHFQLLLVLLVNVLDNLFDLLWRVSFSFHELSEVSDLSVGFKDLLSDGTCFIEFLLVNEHTHPVGPLSPGIMLALGISVAKDALESHYSSLLVKDFVSVAIEIDSLQPNVPLSQDR